MTPKAEAQPIGPEIKRISMDLAISALVARSQSYTDEDIDRLWPDYVDQAREQVRTTRGF